MNDRNADTLSTWSTDLVEQVIKQPVRDAVREALVEQEVARTNTAATTAVSGMGDESATTEADEPSDATEAAADADSAPDHDGVDDEATTSSRSRGLSLALLAGSLVGVGYALVRRRTAQQSDDEQPTDDEQLTDDEQPTDDEQTADAAEGETAEQPAGDDDAHTATSERERDNGPDTAPDPAGDGALRDTERVTPPGTDATTN